MPKKETPESLLTKLMGKKAANALLVKIDKMIAKGESAAKIEKATQDEIANYIGLQVDDVIKITVGPKEFKKFPPALTVNIRKVLFKKITTPKVVGQVIKRKISVKP
jgi:hypothetical protein